MSFGALGNRKDEGKALHFNALKSACFSAPFYLSNLYLVLVYEWCLWCFSVYVIPQSILTHPIALESRMPRQ
jgi:hypothetical protein